MKVLRPSNPQLAINMAMALKTSQQEGLITTDEYLRAFHGILTTQDYTFVGFFDREHKCLIDDDGKRLGELQPGDSFVED